MGRGTKPHCGGQSLALKPKRQKAEKEGDALTALRPLQNGEVDKLFVGEGR